MSSATPQPYNVRWNADTASLQYEFATGWLDVPTGMPGATAWGDITGTLSDQTDLQSALDAKLSGVAWGIITGTLSDQTDLQAALDAKATVGGADTQVQYNNNGALAGDDGLTYSPGSLTIGNSGGEGTLFLSAKTGGGGISGILELEAAGGGTMSVALNAASTGGGQMILPDANSGVLMDAAGSGNLSWSSITGYIPLAVAATPPSSPAVGWVYFDTTIDSGAMGAGSIQVFGNDSAWHTVTMV